MSAFIDRIDEMASLENEYARDSASFVVIYGRRRVGKTTLINHFCENKKAIYFLATEENESENRNAFKELVAETFDNSLLASAILDSWTPIFKIIADESRGERIVLVMDEFQNLGKANKAFPSVMQKIWDEILSKSNVMLILCGSLINMMTSQVLNYDSPLYGRRTAQIKLKQIDFSYYHEFDETLSLEEQIEQYAVTGGVPKYIELFDKKKDIYKSIKENILSTSSFLYAEPEFLLQKEVSEIGSYFSILKAIAAGNHKLSKIATALGVSQSNLTNYLKTLIDLDIIEREVPVTEENPEKSKMGLYRIKDNFIAFWFKFVYPNRSMLESGHPEYVEDKIKNNFIDNHVSYIYEDVCRGDIWKLLSEGITFNRAGRWWSKDVEIDIVAYDSTGADIVFGECKYSKNKKGLSVLNDLQEKAKTVNWNKDNRKEYYVLYSKSGFTDELVEYATEHINVYLKQL
ncbi:ATP-binding protein [Pseudobutyrivibrio xylanivorans]|uniref:ATP-binding protein n=1 Tax=Pseudobutyrivibrio xylanivorans TaxID=185007 RepID=A0A5P6VL64_PSEXY|nr:ATP-binding protein [Pseudobutyrivibrio xylanivorans]QFJ53406.1 ATP-binding protein [Pseudobutyrivibrio xylanivorans]